LIRNCLSRGVGNKTGPIDYQGQPVSLFGGELGKQVSCLIINLKVIKDNLYVFQFLTYVVYKINY